MLQAALKGQWFSPIVDGYVLPETVADIYAAGQQNAVPLLAGWNADEIRASVTLAPVEPTVASFTEQTRKRFGPAADAILKVYAAATDAEAIESRPRWPTTCSSATALGSGSRSTRHRAPVYRYSFDRKIPIAPDTKVNGKVATAKDIGARHAGEIEYVFGQLDSVPNVTWTRRTGRCRIR